MEAAGGDGAAWPEIAVFYNPLPQQVTVPLPEGRWRLLCDGVSSSLWRGSEVIRTGSTVLLPYSATILGQV